METTEQSDTNTETSASTPAPSAEPAAEPAAATSSDAPQPVLKPTVTDRFDEVARVVKEESGNVEAEPTAEIPAEPKEAEATSAATTDSIAMLAIPVRLKPSSISGAPLKQFNTAGTPLPIIKPRNFAPYLPMIVIDAGHGGKDPGAISKSRKRTREKHITLAYAKELATALRQTGKYRVRLTRNKDQFVALNKRVDIARNAKADLFISLHADASKSKNTKGFSVYTLSAQRAERELRTTTRQALKKEVIKDVDFAEQDNLVKHAFLHLAKNNTAKRSLDFAQLLVKHVGGASQLIRRPHRHASLKVLTSIDVPSVLIELGFLTNRSDEKNLLSSRYRSKITRHIVSAIDALFVM